MKKLLLASFLALSSCAGQTVTQTKYIVPPAINLPPAASLNLQSEQFYEILTSPTDTSAYNFTNQVKAMGNPNSFVGISNSDVANYLDDQYQLISYIQQLQAQISAYNFYIKQLNAEVATPATGVK